MKNFFGFLLASLIAQQSVMAGVIVTLRAPQGGVEYRLLELQHDKENYDHVFIYEFVSQRLGDGKSKWQYSRTLLDSSELEMKTYIAQKSPSSLSEAQAVELLNLASKKAERSKDKLGLAVVSTLTGPVGPALFWGAGLIENLSAGQKADLALTETHPFNLLSAMENEKSVYPEDLNYLPILEQEIQSYTAKSDSVFEHSLLTKKEKLQKQKELREGIKDLYGP